MNAHGSSIFGGDREQLVGSFFDDFAANPERVAYFSERFRKVYELGTPFEEEYEVQTDAIDVRWLHYQVVPLASGVAVTARDITERKRGEAALRESEAKYRALTEQASDAIMSVDQQMRFLDANESALALFRLSLSELQQLTVMDVFENVDNPAAAAELRDGRTVLRERTLVRPDGTRAQVEVSAKLLDDGRIQAIARDLTERRRHEEQLRESERRFINVVQHVPGVFFTLVPQEGPGVEGEIRARLRFDFLSDGIKSITGHDARAFEGPDRVTLVDLLHPDDRVILDGADDLILAGKPFAVDVRLIHTDGTTHWAHLKAEANLDADGRMESAGGVMLDITERKQTEEALHLRERAMEAMTQGLVIIDATSDETPIVYVNPAFEELSGYSLAELVGQSPTVFDGPQTDSEAIRKLRTALAAKQNATNPRDARASTWVEPRTPAAPGAAKRSRFLIQCRGRSERPIAAERLGRCSATRSRGPSRGHVLQGHARRTAPNTQLPPPGSGPHGTRQQSGRRQPRPHCRSAGPHAAPPSPGHAPRACRPQRP